MPGDRQPRVTLEHRVLVPKGEVAVYDYPGQEPAVVMTHGFPDDSRIYLPLVDELAERRVVIFDFLGHGKSGRGASWPLEPGQREAELGAVLHALELKHPILVGHDSGGPVVVNFALAHPRHVGGLVLLNTYYGNAPTLRLPDMIQLLATGELKPLADAMIDDPAQRQWLLLHTRRCFGYDPSAPDGVGRFSVQPQFFGDEAQPNALAAIRAWTAELWQDVALQDVRVVTGALAELTAPVTLAFGIHDKYLNSDLARHLSMYFAEAVVEPIQDASHWPQWDQPFAVAESIRGVVLRGSAENPAAGPTTGATR